jgi:hypothetical protein
MLHTYFLYHLVDLYDLFYLVNIIQILIYYGINADIFYHDFDFFIGFAKNTCFVALNIVRLFICRISDDSLHDEMIKITQPDIGKKLYESINSLAPIVKRHQRVAPHINYNTEANNTDIQNKHRQSEERGRGNSPIA